LLKKAMDDASDTKKLEKLTEQVSELEDAAKAARESLE
jgi:hypothetical protein